MSKADELAERLRTLTDSAIQTDQRIIETLQAENAKLHEEIEQWHRLTANIELPEYPLTEFQPKDLERENAKLRELVRHLRECTRHNVCAGCEYADDACDFDYDMRELGIEVDA